ncbi:MAG: MFS transporter [Clostridiales bacterium]|nr:MFS transporter [Clostridiales bacterium]
MENKLTKGRKLGYCSGIISESLLYNMFYTYYLVFLTDIVKMSPALAGTVSFISIIWDAVTDPIIGTFADKNGADKRKFMARAAFPMGLAFVGAFLNIGSNSGVVQFIYYTAMAMLFWLAYTVYTIPYYAVVAEITQDYDERTSIRGTSSLINTLAILSGNAVPAILPGVFAGMGISISMGWTTTAICMAVFAILFALLASFSLRGIRLQKAEAVAEQGEKKKIKDIFVEFISVFKIKPFKWFMMFIVFFLIASSMIQTSFVYMIKDCVRPQPNAFSNAVLGAMGDGITISDIYMFVVILVLISTMAVFIPIVTTIAEKKDRRTSSLIFMSIMAVGLIICRIIGVHSIPVLIGITASMAIGMANFWTVFYSMAYDLVEVDEFVTGVRRESVITAVPQFFQKFGAAIGVWSVSLMLQACGYNGSLEVQSAKVVSGIENIVTIVPAIVLAISIFGMVKYPITKKTFTHLKEELEKKRENKEFDQTGFEKLI